MSTPIAEQRSCIVRIALTPARRRSLGRMARENSQTADALASQLLSEVIDKDEPATESVSQTASESRP